MNETLFKKVLDNRAKLSNKSRRINTKRAVKMLRTRLIDLENEGYDQDKLMNIMLDRNWLGIKKAWLTMIQPKHLHVHRSLSGAVQGLVKHTAIPKSNYAQKHAHANQVRQAGIDALANLKKITKNKQ